MASAASPKCSRWGAGHRACAHEARAQGLGRAARRGAGGAAALPAPCAAAVVPAAAGRTPQRKRATRARARAQVRDWYVESFRDLRSSSPIKDVAGEAQFTDLLRHIYRRHVSGSFAGGRVGVFGRAGVCQARGERAAPAPRRARAPRPPLGADGLWYKSMRFRRPDLIPRLPSPTPSGQRGAHDGHGGAGAQEGAGGEELRDRWGSPDQIG